MLEGVVNFRDVGGHRTTDGATVRTGWIYRAAHFGGATDADLAEVHKIATRSGMRLHLADYHLAMARHLRALARQR